MDVPLTILVAFGGMCVILFLCAVLIYGIQHRTIRRLLSERSALTAEMSHQRAVHDRRINALVAIHAAFYSLNQAVLQYSALIAAGSKPEDPAFHQIIRLQRELSDCISQHAIFIDEELESLLSGTSSNLARLAQEVHTVISEAERSHSEALSTEERLDAFDRILTDAGPMIGTAKDAIKMAILDLKSAQATEQLAPLESF